MYRPMSGRGGQPSRVIASVLLLTSLLGCSGSQDSDQETLRRSFVILGLDGATWDVLRTSASYSPFPLRVTHGPHGRNGDCAGW